MANPASQNKERKTEVKQLFWCNFQRVSFSGSQLCFFTFPFFVPTNCCTRLSQQIATDPSISSVTGWPLLWFLLRIYLFALWLYRICKCPTWRSVFRACWRQFPPEYEVGIGGLLWMAMVGFQKNLELQLTIWRENKIVYRQELYSYQNMREILQVNKDLHKL